MPEAGTASASWTLPAPERFRLAPTVHSHGAFQCPPFRWIGDEGILERILRDPAGIPRLVRVGEEEVREVDVLPQPGGGHRPAEVSRLLLRVETPGWEPSDEARVGIEESVVFMLGLDRDLFEFHELCRDHEVLSRIPEIGAGRLLRCPTLWEELVKAICGTNVRWAQAVKMIEGVCRLGEEVEGRHAWPGPTAVVEAGEEWLREEARLGYRAPYVVDLARSLEEGTLDPGPVEAGVPGRDELRQFFLSVNGIGRVTADHLLTLYGHTERISVDASVIAFMRDRHFGGRTPSERQIRAHFEEWGEWQALAYWFEVVQEMWWPAVGVSF